MPDAPGASRGVAGRSAALAFARDITRICVRDLEETLAAVIVHGSLTLGDYVPGQSDVDLLAIVDRPLADGDIDVLTRAVTIHATRAHQSLDLRVITAATAATPTPMPPMELYMRCEPSSAPEIVARQPREPDLVIELSVCRLHGRALHGPAPPEILGPVSESWVLLVGDAQLARWQALTHDARHAVLMVLTACRIWRFAEERVHCSKSAAGHWAVARDPSLDAVRGALRTRAGEPAAIEPAEIGRLLNAARASIT
jgi:Domain of unknown function (DUF4111)/Nucleotidyltransferase domain